MTASDDKQELHARISTVAHDAIHDFASAEGFTVTSLLEEFADNLASPYALTLISGARRRTAEARRRPRKQATAPAGSV